MGPFEPVIDQKYDMKIVLDSTAEVAIIMIDATVVCVINDPRAGDTGKLGLFTESRTSFDNFHVYKE